ncbi:bifunctional diaminohydroxyphosphoribosylaminopyrimidine deaminase/5-amino-6-(5-phosphoribosylamino)uracil reductase RibD [Nonomuraea endophytica]|uniref:bifunctional diaminohydroxyphosphoribosylaminopyrimidine deaminase/5-amino-6-(5-phosphoribosylamino)uracil reductase RibD n=1 Tax=Nonomuraea endophytica TaxID=714136 RepID=UPI0037C6F0E6
MRRAIVLSAYGLGSTSPNPPVGCVILDAAGQPVGEGYHARKGEAHAEGNALLAAGAKAKGGTAVVTLEPCNHVGRAPACRQLLIDAGISRVVVALIDPTSRGDGGITELRKAGVSVETDVLADEAALVLGSWHTALALGRPVVTWIYTDGPDGAASAIQRVPGARDVLFTVDAVVDVDGQLTEAVPGRHGLDMLQLPADPIRLDSTDLMRALYTGGVRHLLLDGGADLAQPLLASGFVDHIVAYVPDQGPSAQSQLLGQGMATLYGFQLAEVSPVRGYMKIRARRTT